MARVELGGGRLGEATRRQRWSTTGRQLPLQEPTVPEAHRKGNHDAREVGSQYRGGCVPAWRGNCDRSVADRRRRREEQLADGEGRQGQEPHEEGLQRLRSRACRSAGCAGAAGRDRRAGAARAAGRHWHSGAARTAGDTGAQGPRGDTGPAGPQGVQGPEGPPGPGRHTSSSTRRSRSGVSPPAYATRSPLSRSRCRGQGRSRCRDRCGSRSAMRWDSRTRSS